MDFHSDCGSEFINHTVANLLNKLLIEQTKSRPRHSNDNGLAEAKNGAVVRKHMGHWHIAAGHTEAIIERTDMPELLTARTELVQMEALTDAQLDELQKEFELHRDRAITDLERIRARRQGRIHDTLRAAKNLFKNAYSTACWSTDKNG